MSPTSTARIRQTRNPLSTWPCWAASPTRFLLFCAMRHGTRPTCHVENPKPISVCLQANCTTDPRCVCRHDLRGLSQLSRGCPLTPASCTWAPLWCRRWPFLVIGPLLRSFVCTAIKVNKRTLPAPTTYIYLHSIPPFQKKHTTVLHSNDKCEMIFTVRGTVITKTQKIKFFFGFHFRA